MRELCRRESLAESAFHSWRRTIAQRDGQLAPRRRQTAPGDGEIASPDGQMATSRPAQSGPTFVPAVVTSTAQRASGLPGSSARRDNSAPPGSNASEREGAITIELSGGRVLRLPTSIDVARIAELMHALESRGVR